MSFNDGVKITSQKQVTIGNTVIFGQNILIYNHDHDYKQKNYIERDVMQRGNVEIKDNVWICSGVIILRSVCINSGTVIAAETVVKSGTNLPEKSLLFNERKDIVKSIIKNDDLIVLAGDNLLDFSLKGFIEYFKQKNKTCVMRYFEDSIEKLRKTGVAKVDNNGQIVNMVEKPQNPESDWAIPPFYIYTKEDIYKIEKGINEG